MKNKPTANGIRAVVLFLLITGTFLGMTPSSGSASPSSSFVHQWPPTPSITAYLLENRVQAGFFPPNAMLTLEITGNDTVYTDYGVAVLDQWGYGQFTFVLGSAFSLQPGQTVTVTDGTTTKDLTVMDLYVDSYDPVQKTIAGYSKPGSLVQVNIWEQGGLFQAASPDGTTGRWQVAFGASYAPFSPFTSGSASSTDEDGDITQFQINMGFLSARNDWPGADNVYFTNCSPARRYTLSIDDPSNGQGVDYTAEQYCTVAAWGTYINFIFSDFELRPGDQITVASAHHVRMLTFTPKGSLSFDVKNNFIRGTNRPDAYLSVTTPGAQRTGKAGSDGKWSIDYNQAGPNGEPVEHITRGMSGSIQEYNSVGDSTAYGWLVPAPFLEVRPQFDTVLAVGFKPGDLVTLSVDGLQGQHADLTTIAGAPPAPAANIAFGDFAKLGFDLQPGQVLTASVEGITFSYLIQDLVVTKFDVIADTVKGIGTPKTQVVVTAISVTGQRFTRRVTADEAGNWMVNFASTANPSDTPVSFDLQPSSQGVALEINNAGDKSWANNWTILPPISGSAVGVGWFNSPSGAFPANPSSAEKALVAFAAKYNKNTQVLNGTVEFFFKGFCFTSTTLDWMAVEGNRMQLSGTGSVNKAGSYGFMINAVASSTKSAFRIRIWDKATDKVVYDNLPGAPDYVAPTQLLNGGEIRVSK